MQISLALREEAFLNNSSFEYFYLNFFKEKIIKNIKTNMN